MDRTKLSVKDPVLIENYDPRWADMFAEEKFRILEKVNQSDAVVHHVGSTSVLGLAAKPIIDIMVVVRDHSAGEASVAALTELGYEYRGELGIPGRFYFSKHYPYRYHLHMYPAGHSEITRLIVFRDYLCANPDAAREYVKLKCHLAERFCEDREAYAQAKSSFIRSIEAKARSPRNPL